MDIETLRTFDLFEGMSDEEELEVDGPHDVRCRCVDDGAGGLTDAFASLSPGDLQAFAAPEPMYSLRVDVVAFSS